MATYKLDNGDALGAERCGDGSILFTLIREIRGEIYANQFRWLPEPDETGHIVLMNSTRDRLLSKCIQELDTLTNAPR